MAQKLVNNNQHAKIRILEGMIHFKLNNLDDAMQAYDNANKKLLGKDTITVEILGFLHYQLSRIAQYKEEHDLAIGELISSTEYYKAANNHQKALSNLFHIIYYDLRNNTGLEIETYLKKIDFSIHKLRDKTDKNRNIAELSLYRGLISNNEKKVRNELFNAIKLFAKLGMYDKCTYSTVELSKMEATCSLKQALKVANEAINYSDNSNSNLEKGRAILNLCAIKRMMNDNQDLETLEKQGFDLLAKTPCFDAANILLDLVTTIILSTNSSIELFKANTYVRLAFDMFNELSIKNGKIACKLIEGIANIVSESSEGASKVSLSLINLRRMCKNSYITNLKCEFNNVILLLISDIPIVENLKKNYSDFPVFTQMLLYQLLGIIRYLEDRGDGITLLTQSNELMEKMVKNNKEFQVLLDVSRDRVSKYF